MIFVNLVINDNSISSGWMIEGAQINPVIPFTSNLSNEDKIVVETRLDIISDQDLSMVNLFYLYFKLLKSNSIIF